MNKNLFSNIFSFGGKKRIKCECDKNLSEEATCSRALSWISLKYEEKEFDYLKSTYEKILHDDKLVDIEQTK